MANIIQNTLAGTADLLTMPTDVIGSFEGLGRGVLNVLSGDDEFLQGFADSKAFEVSQAINDFNTEFFGADTREDSSVRATLQDFLPLIAGGLTGRSKALAKRGIASGKLSKRYLQQGNEKLAKKYAKDKRKFYVDALKDELEKQAVMTLPFSMMGVTSGNPVMRTAEIIGGVSLLNKGRKRLGSFAAKQASAKKYLGMSDAERLKNDLESSAFVTKHLDATGGVASALLAEGLIDEKELRKLSGRIQDAASNSPLHKEMTTLMRDLDSKSDLEELHHYLNLKAEASQRYTAAGKSILKEFDDMDVTTQDLDEWLLKYNIKLDPAMDAKKFRSELEEIVTGWDKAELQKRLDVNPALLKEIGTKNVKT